MLQPGLEFPGVLQLSRSAAKVFANTTCLHGPKAADDVAALMADAEARGRIWREDQVERSISMPLFVV